MDHGKGLRVCTMHGTWQVHFPSMWIYWAENFSANAASNCVCTPPKPPLLMHTMVSLGCTSRHHLLHQGGDIVGRQPSGPQRLQRLGRVPIQPRRVAKGQISLFQCPGQLGLHGAQLHGVAARLKDRQDALSLANLLAQPIQGCPNGGGVVGKSSYSAIPATVPRNSIRRRTF